jgi:DNA replication protein DnaC
MPFVRVATSKCAACRKADADREERARYETAKRERQAEILDLLHNAGPNVAEHRDATLDSFDTAECGDMPVAAAREFIAATLASRAYDPVRGLYLWGGTGTGKTHLAVGVLRELLSDPRVKPCDVLYDHAAELMARIQDTYGTGTSTMELLERRFKARVWVLDDLGTERASDDIARHLTLIFTKRAMRPTVVTSNLAPEQFERRRPELVRVVSRLGPAYFRAVEVKGRDRRFD